MSIQLIDTTTGKGDDPQTGGNKINANLSGQWDEDRLMQVSTVENVLLAAGGTAVLANVTSGPGNVEFIQLAVESAGTGAVSDRSSLMADTTIRLTVDGVVLTPVPVGLFYLIYGTTPGNAPNPAPKTFLADDFAVPKYPTDNPPNFGAFRRLFIPFGVSCKIELINGSSVAGGYIYSQVQYRQGAIPLNLTGTRRKRFGMQVTTFTSLAAYQSLQLLNVTGRGQLDSIQLFLFGPGSSLSFLEGNPTLALDGNAQTWGGTEDFFGTQYYGSYITGACSNAWGVPINTGIQVSNTPQTAWGGYRIFKRDPMIFNASAQFSIINGQSGEGASAPPTINAAAVAFYHLDS